MGESRVESCHQYLGHVSEGALTSDLLLGVVVPLGAAVYFMAKLCTLVLPTLRETLHMLKSVSWSDVPHFGPAVSKGEPSVM